MKRTFLFMIISVLCISLIMSFSALAEPTDSSDITSSGTVSDEPAENICDHIWEDDKDGTLGKHCTLCEVDYCQSNEHTQGTAASCTKKAVCSICGEEYGEILPHKFTETNDCSAKVNCDNCGELIKSAGNHDWEPASCTKIKTCKVCGATEGKILLHLWSEGTVTKAPTLTVNGSMRFVCEKCGLINNQTIYYTSESEASPTDLILPIIIGVIVLLIVIIVIVVIVIIRRRKR